MSDEEDVHSGEESEEEEETKMAPPEDSGPSEAELAMQKRRQGTAKSSDELDEDAQELLEANRLEREKMEEEIQELRERSQQRKKEREEQEREMAERRTEEESRRKQEEEERKSKKEAEDNSRKAARDQKMAEFDKFKNQGKPNFVISKRDGVPGVPDDSQGDESQGEKKSKEQVEAEKRAILAQRIQPLDISGFDVGKLTEKAKELNGLIYRLESDKYDLEKRFKEQQFDMMELADKARQMNQVGRGGLKRVQLTQEEVDPIQEKFAGAPAKIVMYSQFERQKDKRKYGDRHDVFHGPTWVAPPDRVLAYKNVVWDENTGLPSYVDIPGMERPAEEGEEEE